MCSIVDILSMSVDEGPAEESAGSDVDVLCEFEAFPWMTESNGR